MADANKESVFEKLRKDVKNGEGIEIILCDGAQFIKDSTAGSSDPDFYTMLGEQSSRSHDLDRRLIGYAEFNHGAGLGLANMNSQLSGYRILVISEEAIADYRKL